MKSYRNYVLLGIMIIASMFLFGNACPIERVIGIPCPGCNMFSALYWLFIKGNLAMAHYYHPAILPLLLYGALCLMLFIKDKEKMGKTALFRYSTSVFLVIFIVIYLYRMFTIFPDMPMMLNEDAVLIKLFHRF